MSYGSAMLDFNVHKYYRDLDQGSSVMAEYVWVGGNGSFRCKTKTLPAECKALEDYPIWNYDGSSTNQATGAKSEVHIKPAAVFPDPFRGGKNVLVLCECVLAYEENGERKYKPHPTNKRHATYKLFEENQKVKDGEWWFGIEQEYTLFYADRRTPFGWPTNGYPRPQGPFYCGVGIENAYGRRIADGHYRACLYAGIKMSGINAEVMAGQWEYQVGPCLGIESGDMLMMSRYIMQRVCEDFGVVVSFHPKPMSGDWNGAGCHTNTSSKAMRDAGGLDVIIEAMSLLEKKHKFHIKQYGEDNDKRLTGHHETASIDTFGYGVGNRGKSIRIPTETNLNKRGYFEDRRPASNMNPYIVTGLIAETCTFPNLKESESAFNNQ